jgi:hypothetical protein
MHDGIVSETLKRKLRLMLRHPPIKDIVQKQIGEQRANHAPYTKGNFQFERTVAGWRERYALLDLRRKK